MSQLQRIASSRFSSLVVTVFALLVFGSGAVSAAPWDDLLKKGEELIDDTVDDVLDGDKESEKSQEPAQQTNTAQEAAPSDKSTEQEKLDYMNLATYAGIYSGMATACNDPVGPKVRADFEARLPQAPGNRQSLKSRFDGLHDSRALGPNCDGLVAARSDYESAMRAIGAEPVKGSDDFTPPVSEQKLRELRSLAGYAGMFAGRAAACDRSIAATIRPDFSAQIASKYPEQQAVLMGEFDNVYPALADSWCDETRLGMVKQRYESNMRLQGLTPVLDDSPKAAAVSSPKPAPAPAAPDKATSGDSKAPEQCNLSVLDRLHCKTMVANPSNYPACKVEACKKYLASQ